MYYLDNGNSVKQFENPKDFVLNFIKNFRSKYGKISSQVIGQMIIDLKNQFQLVKDFEFQSKETKLADAISEKKATSEVLANILLLATFNDQDVKMRKFSILIADGKIPEGVQGSTTNQIKHFGICFSVTGEHYFERYVDLDRVIDSLSDIKFFSNEEIRLDHSKDFYFAIINKIYNIKANSIDELYEKIIQCKDKSEPSKVI